MRPQLGVLTFELCLIPIELRPIPLVHAKFFFIFVCCKEAGAEFFWLEPAEKNSHIQKLV